MGIDRPHGSVAVDHVVPRAALPLHRKPRKRFHGDLIFVACTQSAKESNGGGERDIGLHGGHHPHDDVDGL